MLTICLGYYVNTKSREKKFDTTCPPLPKKFLFTSPIAVNSNKDLLHYKREQMFDPEWR